MNENGWTLKIKIIHLIRKIVGGTFSRFFKPEPKKNGISVIISTKNEKEWIGLELISLKNFADEIIIADASTDETPRIIKQISKKYKLNISLDRHKSKNYLGSTKEHATQLNSALKKTKFRWIVRLDGDIVARTNGRYDIRRLRQFILNLNQNIHYKIYVPTILLAGDVFHQYKKQKINNEARIYTASSKIKFISGKKHEGLRTPFYYKPLFLKNNFFFHFHIKNPKKMLFRKFWTSWRKNNEGFAKLEDYVKNKIKKIWNTPSIKKAFELYMKEFSSTLVPYDKKKFGKYPYLLRNKTIRRH